MNGGGSLLGLLSLGGSHPHEGPSDLSLAGLRMGFTGTRSTHRIE